MTWVKLDDGFFRHPKVIALTRDARLLFLAGLCHCASNLTDGRISAGAVRLVAAEADVKPTVARQLVAAGMWREAEGGGFEVHDYLDYQPARREVEADREAARERMRKARTTRRSSGERSAEQTANGDRSSPVGSGNPVPSRPTPPSPPSADDREPVDTSGAKAPRKRTTKTTARGVDPPLTNDDGVYQPLPLPDVGAGLQPGDLWPEMARRRLQLATEAGRAPARHGQYGWLQVTATNLAAEHHDQAERVLADTQPGWPADYVIWELDPDLALRDWHVGPPTGDAPARPAVAPVPAPPGAADAARAALRATRITDPDDPQDAA